jgi:hypothetical protein
MAEEKPPPKEDTPPARRRWWVRLALWLLVVGFVLALLLTAGGFWAWRNRTPLANNFLRKTFAAFDAQIGTLDVTSEHVVIRDVTVRDPASGAVIATADHLIWQPDWSKMRALNLGRFRLEGLKLDATAEQLRSWNADNRPDKTMPPPPGGGWEMPQIVIEGTELKDVSVNVRGDASAPSLRFKLQHSVEGLDLSDTTRPRLRRATLKVDDLAITQPDGKEIAIQSLDLAASLRDSDRMIVLEESHLNGARLNLTPWLWQWLTLRDENDASRTPPVAASTAPPLPFAGIVIRDLGIVGMEFKIEPGAIGGALPLSGGAKLDYELRDLEWRISGPSKPGRQTLKLAEASLRPINGDGEIAIGAGVLNISAGEKEWIVQEAGLKGASLHWTQALESALLSGTTAKTDAAPVSTPPSPALIIEKADIAALKLRVEKTKLSPLALSSTLTISGEALRITDEAITSPKKQTLRITDTSLAMPDAAGVTEPMLTLADAALEITPDVFKERSHIDAITIGKPVVRLTEKTAPWMLPPVHGPAPAPSATPAPAPAAPPPPAPAATAMTPFWEKLTFGNLQITEGQIEYSSTWTDRVEARTGVTLTTEPPPAAGGMPLHKLVLKDVKGSLPDIAKLPVAGLDSIELSVRLPEVWQEKKIETFKVQGGRIEVGEALMSFLNKPGTTTVTDATPPAPEKKDAAPPPAVTLENKIAKWRVGELDIGRVGITLYKLAPGMPPVHFSVSLNAKDTPLEADEIAKNTQKQRVELESLVIPSPYDPLRTVADLDTVFIDFSLDALAAQRIDQIEVVSPKLYVGEDLFWYIEYCRKYAAGEIVTDKDAPKVAANDAEIAFGAANAAMKSDKPKGWDVSKIKVHAGKLIVAPKGVPLSGFHQPFPFSFESALNDGVFEATLDIPPDTYTLEDLKLEFRGTSGHVKFNLPVKGRDNNLTEVFRVDQIRWKQLHIEDAFLTVTYDMNGIYAQLGSAAYEGYVNGAFNVYLDQSFSWDGWLTGTGVKTTEITEKLCPSYFMLDGKVDGKIIAFGSSKDLHQADVEFKNATPGKMSISALNELIEDYAKESHILTSQITRIGLETLRDFDYDRVSGKGRFYGREGGGKLLFEGRQGKRNFDINVFDHRWKEDPKPKQEEQTDETVAAQQP